MIELLSPVGDFECLKASIQNGADAVYFGANLFSARAYAENFDYENLEKVITYAKLRKVKTHLTLNTLIKENEFETAFNLAKKAYELGIDAIIVQDLGLASVLIKEFPDLDIHASTQMTTHNLEGVKELEKMGFKRAVLARELPINEIEYICKNSNIEIEVFVHGALCISYSGECLFSSMIGGRSGNRGKCAQPCRLPYKLIDENENILDNGYLLSPRDLCSLEHLPSLIAANVTSLKIEGRMKSPEYVATVTRIYKKYIKLAEKYLSGKIDKYIVDEKDKQDLMQVFNRGGFSNGHLTPPNKNLIFSKKPNNMGLTLGKISDYNPKKGLVTLTLENNLSIGDSVSFENENTIYMVSELMKNSQNIKLANIGQTITIGRMKGNINIGDKIYKMSSKELLASAVNSFNKEYKKNLVDCKLNIKTNRKINCNLYCKNFNIAIDFLYDYIPETAQNAPITKDTIIKQFNKTLDTCFEFNNIEINLADNLFIPVAILNDIRRTSIKKLEDKIIESFKRHYNNNFKQTKNRKNLNKTNSISLLLNILHTDYDYSKLENIDRVYVPLKYFADKKYKNTIDILSKFKLYIYMPIIIRKDYTDIAKKTIKDALESFDIKGIVISNLSQIDFIPNSNLDIIGNYSLNTYNSYTANKLNTLNIQTVTVSPELDKQAIIDFCNNTNINKAFIVYGNIPLMTMNYCLLGKSNKCYKDCKKNCIANKTFFLKDRLGLKFHVIPDNTQTISTIYNSKTTSINYSDFNINSVRIDILDESINDINKIISSTLSHERMEGENFTNGNLNRIV